MSTPQYVLELREHVGHRLLWLHGVTALVLRNDGQEVLLGQRRDTGEWALITGIIDPGEQPADAALRELAEEAGIEGKVERLLWVRTGEEVHYANGDAAQYLDVLFEVSHLSGDPYPADGENLAVAWFPLSDLPPLRAHSAEVLAEYCSPHGPRPFLVT